MLVLLLRTAKHVCLHRRSNYEFDRGKLNFLARFLHALTGVLLYIQTHTLSLRVCPSVEFWQLHLATLS